MIRTCCAIAMLAITSPALAQTQPYFIYRCTVMDGVSVKPGGMLGRDKDEQDYAKKISPIVLDTQTGETKLGTVLLEPIYDIVNHGNAIEPFEATDPLGGIGTILIIRVDLPPPYRMFATFASGSAYSGTCERTQKPAG